VIQIPSKSSFTPIKDLPEVPTQSLSIAQLKPDLASPQLALPSSSHQLLLWDPSSKSDQPFSQPTSPKGHQLPLLDLKPGRLFSQLYLSHALLLLKKSSCSDPASSQLARPDNSLGPRFFQLFYLSLLPLFKKVMAVSGPFTTTFAKMNLCS